VPYGCTYRLPTLISQLLNKSHAKKPNSWSLHKKWLRIFCKKVRRIDHWQINDETERARRLGTKTREEIGKGNQMTALRFQTMRYHWPSFGASFLQVQVPD